ncbi:uncharacterized protein SCHCODRAFT_01251247 [Schizophyllum commune H4-8]|uniref:uncharacterized protein n=1 Tax=Schizophyllum commune (strain H4-8 / FGSC 9210) TaxID=578458 RepID=UPI00215EF63E|nr:uncharacterized protein SCHCODRAFT_01251247 [Schizophyllum commune H4-8]KAI5898659.1 hypothetical protein SCHCODRAFT_01251247 [Schizophyllum commune H4-8]
MLFPSGRSAMASLRAVSFAWRPVCSFSTSTPWMNDIRSSTFASRFLDASFMHDNSRPCSQDHTTAFPTIPAASFERSEATILEDLRTCRPAQYHSDPQPPSRSSRT